MTAVTHKLRTGTLDPLATLTALSWSPRSSRSCKRVAKCAVQRRHCQAVRRRSRSHTSHQIPSSASEQVASIGGGLPIGGRVEVVGLVDGHEGRARHFTGCLIAPAAQPQSDPQAWYPQKQPGRHALT